MSVDGFRRAHGPYEQASGGWKLILVRKNGRRTAKTCATRAEAEGVIEQLKLAATGSRSIRSAVTEYLAACAERGLAPPSVERIEYHLERIFDLEHNGDKPLTWLRARGAELYDGARTRPTAREKPPAVDTHRNALTEGKAFTTWCVKRKLLKVDPFAEVEAIGRRRAGRSKPQHRVDESRKLVDYLLGLCAVRVEPEVVGTLTTFLLGERAHEVVERDIRDLDDGGRLLWIDDSKSDEGRRTLEVPGVLQPLLLALAEGRGGDQPLFVATDGPGAKRKRGTRRATRHWLLYHVRKLCKAAGVPVIPTHGLRRSHISHARAAGTTGEIVAAQVGHGSVAVQDRSYVAAGAADAGRRERAFKVLQGGRP